GVVIASGGYPGEYRTGLPIAGVEHAEAHAGVTVFHAGTARRDGRLTTAGGRVLGVTALGADIPAAVARAYAGAGEIRFDGLHYRRDIGYRALRRLDEHPPGAGGSRWATPGGSPPTPAHPRPRPARARAPHS